MGEDDLPGRVGELIRYGRIASVDLAAGRVTVALGEIETQPIRFFSGGAGGTRIWSRPKVGEQVALLAPDGDIEGAIALRGVHSTAFPPIGDPDRELVRFEDGAEIAYDPTNGVLEILLPAGGYAHVVAPGGLTIVGDVTIEGKLTAAVDVVADIVSLKDHRHDQVQAGGALSGRPAA